MHYKPYFQEKLVNLKSKNLYRQPKDTILGLLNFCSNDYLNLSQNLNIKKAAIDATNKYGVGAQASSYVFSNNSLKKDLEHKLSKLKNTASSIVLGSGYLSGIGIIPALMNKNDLIIADKLIHSSLIDGCKLSRAQLLRFLHNDINHCENILKKHSKFTGKKLIITETIFSMDGDLGKVVELLELAKKYNCLILTDDAHGLGIIKQKYSNYDFHLQCGTLSKAAGGYGGYVCSSNLMIDYLRNFTKSAIYSTALPPAVLASNLKAVEIILKDKTFGKKALENAQYFCKLLKLPKPQSTIIPIIIGDARKALEISKQLKQQGFLISAIRPPTVETGKSRLRVTFCAGHKKSDIKELANLISKFISRNNK
jgi:8-amino-7-oxononanoate synthase